MQEIKFDFRPFVEAMERAAEQAVEVFKSIQRKRVARETITSSYAPGPFTGSVDI